MSSGDIKPNDELSGGDHVNIHQTEKSEILADPDLLNDAFDGENHEHAEGLWSAAKSHPWACFWAFIMCFTIVSLSPASFLVPGPRIW